VHADVDECTVNHGNCDKYANCTNFLGSYECTCMTGFAGDGFICTGVFSLIMVLNEATTTLNK